jgi:hypothetical protein
MSAYLKLRILTRRSRGHCGEQQHYTVQLQRGDEAVFVTENSGYSSPWDNGSLSAVEEAAIIMARKLDIPAEDLHGKTLWAPSRAES